MKEKEGDERGRRGTVGSLRALSRAAELKVALSSSSSIALRSSKRPP